MGYSIWISVFKFFYSFLKLVILLNMRIVKGLIASRFLILIAHLVIVITMFWSRDLNARSCLKPNASDSEVTEAVGFLTTLLSCTCAMFAIELGSFLFGVSMFNTSQSLLSIGAHTSACITLSFFILDHWACYTYWYIFWFCSFIPAFMEFCILLSVLCSWWGFSSLPSWSQPLMR